MNANERRGVLQSPGTKDKTRCWEVGENESACFEALTLSEDTSSTLIGGHP